MTDPAALEVQVTFPSETEALNAANHLVGRRLAACGQVTRITSVYRWEGAVEQEPEWLLTVKTVPDRLTEIEQQIHALHPYETPQLTALPLAWASAAYLAWLIDAASPEA